MSHLVYAEIDDRNIPRTWYKGRECRCWEKAGGIKIPFVYGRIQGELMILRSWKNGRGEYLLEIQYQDRIHMIRSCDLLYGHIGGCIGTRKIDYRYAPGQRIQDEKRDITVLSVYRKPVGKSGVLKKMVSYRCNVCGWEKADVQESTLAQGTGCPVCSGKIVKPGYNDIPTTAPWMVPYFPGGREEAALYTQNSGRKVRLQCPYCGRMSEKKIMPATLNRTHSIACPCGDGISFSEKFVFHLMEEVGAEGYMRQLSGKDECWCGSYRYDGSFFYRGSRVLLEIHGVQHYQKTGFEKFAEQTLQDIMENDRRKKALALANGIQPEHYIELDCRRTSLQHLKESILRSPLGKMLELENRQIPWEKIFLEALRPVNRRIIQLALAERQMPTKEIARRCGVSAGHAAKVLDRFGIHGKEERNLRKDKEYFRRKREALLEEMEEMQRRDPSITVARMAKALGRSPAGLYNLLRRWKPPLDMDLLHKNAEEERVQSARERLCKPVQVDLPDGGRLEAESLTEACGRLEKICGVPFAVSSASVSIKGNRLYRGCRFSYQL